MQITNRDSRVLPETEQLIPRVVYSTIGTKKIRSKHLQAIESFRSNNPEYKFVVIDDSDAHDYFASKFHGERILEVFERLIYGQMRADILRVALMLFEGGVYIEISKRLQVFGYSSSSFFRRGILITSTASFAVLSGLFLCFLIGNFTRMTTN